MSFRGVRSRLFLLAFAVVAPTIGLQVWRGADEREQAIERARLKATEVVRVAAADEDASLQDTAQLLRVLTRVSAVVNGPQADCHQFLRSITNEHPRVNAINVARADGSIVCTSLQPEAPSFSLSDRQWFKDATADNAPEIIISNLLISRSTKLPAIVVATGLVAPGHNAASGTLSATMNVGWFSQLVARLQGQAGAAVWILDLRNATVVAQSDRGGAFVGKSLQNHPLLAIARTYPDRAFEVDGFDGTRQIAAVRRMTGNVDSQAVILVTIPSKTIVADADWFLVQSLVAISLTFLVGTLIAWLIAESSIVRPLEVLGRMAESLGAGDLSARATLRRSSVIELQALRTILNRAASQIQARDTELARLAAQDSLTGLANRRSFDKMLNSEWLGAVRTGGRLCVIMIDVDYFKSYNDTYGHVAGDECLRRVSAAIAATVRSSDLVARYGGEEIGVIIADADPAAAWTMSERMIDAVRELRLPHRNSPVGYVTVSAGLATLNPGVEAAPAVMVEAADHALYEAKRAGRNCVVVASSYGDAGSAVR